jgi:hypothetical protein
MKPWSLGHPAHSLVAITIANYAQHNVTDFDISTSTPNPLPGLCSQSPCWSLSSHSSLIQCDIFILVFLVSVPDLTSMPQGWDNVQVWEGLSRQMCSGAQVAQVWQEP